MRSTRDFLTGILTGVAIGLLTAPRTGKETRDKLMEEANKRSDDLKNQWEKGVAQAKQGYEQAKTQVDQYAQQAKEQYNDLKTQVQSSDSGKAKANYNETVDRFADKTKSGIDDARDAVKVS